MRVLQTVLASYRVLFANFGAFVLPALLWTLLSTAAYALTFATLPTNTTTNEYLLDIGPYFLAIFFHAAGAVLMGIAWHRFIILGEPVRHIRPTTTEVIGPYTARAFASTILPITLYIAVAWIYSGDSEETIVTAVFYVGTSLILARLGRLLLVLPASPVGDTRTTVRASLRATANRNTAMFLGLLACDLPWNALIFAVDEWTLIYDDVVVEIASYALTEFLDLARVVTWTAFMSYAYLEFVRPRQSAADHFR